MTPEQRDILNEVARTHGTPAYVYFFDEIIIKAEALRLGFDGRFGLSFAVKSNPNPAVLKEMSPLVDFLDLSSGGEIDLAIGADWAPEHIYFTGPAKTNQELSFALESGISHVVVESAKEARRLNRIAHDAGRRAAVLMRIAPSRVPRGFGAHMSGRPTQFGVPEEVAEECLLELLDLSCIDVHGFHVYSGAQCLQASSIVENFDNMAAIFRRLTSTLGSSPRMLVFGAGMGIPYHADQEPLDLESVIRDSIGILDELLNEFAPAEPRLILESGRYLVGQSGYYLTSVIEVKESKGQKILICDGGMNHHLAACGHMGSVIHRNYPVSNITVGGDTGAAVRYNVVGPLCTMIDTLAHDLELPESREGEVLAIASSGAYGLSSSPLHFISHAAPREILVRYTGTDVEIQDITRLLAGPRAWTRPGGQDVSDGRAV